MSTLKVSTIQDTSGNNSSTPAGIASGTAKAWVNFNGTGTVAIRDDFNVSSITDNGTGEYTINFSTAMPNANYCAAGNGSQDVSSVGHYDSICFISYATGSIKVETFGDPNSPSSETDLNIVCGAIFSS